MKLIRSSMECAQLAGGSSSETRPDSPDSLDRLEEAIRRDPDAQLAEWLDVIAQFGAHYQLDGEEPIEVNPRVDPDATLRFDDTRGQEPA